MDIEGGEELIFAPENELNFLKKCRNLIIEYHLNMDIQSGSLSNFLKCFEEYSFKYQIHSSYFNKYLANKIVFQDILLTFKKL